VTEPDVTYAYDLLDRLTGASQSGNATAAEAAGAAARVSPVGFEEIVRAERVEALAFPSERQRRRGLRQAQPERMEGFDLG
jgi:hypothetical protein